MAPLSSTLGESGAFVYDTKYSMNHFKEFSIHSRLSEIQSIEKYSSPYDILIVGGGITGAATARDAALRGLKVLLVEKGDFASGTSSRSSKLVHGGVRYLEQFELGLVMESTAERARLWRLAPQLVSPIPFLFPAYKNSRVPLWQLSCGLWLYDILALFRTPGLHKTYFKKRCLKEEPAMEQDGLVGAQFYWDGATDDSLLTLANIIDAREAGAICVSRVMCHEISFENSPDGTPHSARLTDETNQKEFNVKFRAVVFATGPWTDIALKGCAPQLPFPKLMQATRGSHIVVSKEVLPARHAVVMTHPIDGRVLFSIPWGDFTIIGTTDIFDNQAPEKTAITSDEIDYLIKSASFYFPNNPIKRDDVVSTWSGLRPLVAPSNGEGEGASEISRDHYLEWRDPGALVITGGKLTTHREMAAQCVDLLLKQCASWKSSLSQGFTPCPTLERPFPQLCFPKEKAVQLKTPPLGNSEASRLSLNTVQQILMTQSVMSIEDFCVRRTQLFYKEGDNGFSTLNKLKPLFCESLGWNDAEWETSLAAYKGYVNANVYRPLGRQN